MTGYGIGDALTPIGRVIVEVRSVNHRFLDLHLRVPREMASVENRVRSEVKRYAERGRLDITVQRRPAAEAGRIGILDPDEIATLYRVIREVQGKLGIPGDVDIEMLLELKDSLLGSFEERIPEEEAWAAVKSPLRSALGSMAEMRAREGEALRSELGDLARKLSAKLAAVERRAPRLVGAIESKIRARVGELTGGLELAPDRVAQEVAILADRSDVREEIARLGSHLDQFGKLLLKGGGVGKRLDFLIQEMNREANTIGSKVADIKISGHVVEMKSLIERLREQLQNVE